MKGWKRNVASIRQQAEKAVASSMRNLVIEGVSCDIFANWESRGDICILALFGVRQSVCGWGKLLLVV